MDVNYKNPKKYKTAKYPIRQPLFFVWLIRVLSKIMLIGKKKKIEKIGMEGLKGPYILLSNHMSFIDFELVAMATGYRRVNNVVNIDGFYRRPWLLELIGAICTRKFTTDIHLIRSIHKVLDRGDVLCMYPEARYSPCGTTSYLPDSLGLLLKRCKVPVVVAIHRGISRLKRSISQAEEANEKYKGKLRVFIGIELAEQLEDEKVLSELMGLADYDVVLASRHYIRYFKDEWETPYSRIDFSHRSDNEIREFFLLYLEGVRELAEKADFDILTHLTCPLRYINGKFKRGVRVEDYENEIRDILKLVIARDRVLEVNTSGLGNSHGETMPCDKVLSWYKELGGRKISLGGDSHVCGKVANGFDTEIEILKKLGFNSHCYFEKRKCHEIAF